MEVSRRKGGKCSNGGKGGGCEEGVRYFGAKEKMLRAR